MTLTFKSCRLLFPVLHCRLAHCCTFTTHVKEPFNFINGERTVPADSIRTYEVVEPRTGKQLCRVQASGSQEVDRAVRVAKEAFKEWSQFSSMVRGRLLVSAGRMIAQNLEDIVQLEVKDTGKPVWEARVDIGSCADSLEYFGGISSAVTGQHVKLAGGSFAMVQREPLGVIAGVGAWNFPMQTCTWKVAPALACGNTMVYKPSQFTPLTAVTLAEILHQVGVPNGVFNVIQGEGETGSLLCNHPEVAKLSFTGSVPTGMKIMQAASMGIKNVTLELGGKSPLIIFEDADMLNAVKATLMANFLTQGEVCSNGTRVFVHKSIFKPFVEKLVEATKNMKIGDPYDEDTTVGATVTKEHSEKVLKYIEEAKKEGATVAYGGERVSQPGEMSGGHYLSPCILTDCHDDMTIVQEEVFGSVASILAFQSEEEVVARANNTPFGLAGAVFTKDLMRGHRVANKIEAGTVWINNFNLYPPVVPFGGYKMSGIGRENGLSVIEHFTQTRTVYVEMGDVDAGPLYKD